MSKFNFEEFLAAEAAASQQRGRMSDGLKTGSKVSYFGLKNDGDEALVRFDYSSPDDIQLYSIHQVEAGGKNRKVECLRTPYDSIDTCPLCAAGYKVYKKMFVRLVEYVPQPDGSVKPEAKIWERRADFSKVIVSYIKDYGDLRDCVFKIKRQGKAGDTNTTYLINYQNPKIYTQENYPADFSGFEGYSLNAYVVLNKSAEDMVAYVETGNFPLPAVTDNKPQQPQHIAPKPQQEGGFARELASSTPQPTRQAANFEQPDPTNRPRRYYSV